jgi:phosphohistidine phosphatase
MAIHTLYLVRHAVAEPRGDAWPDDDQRPLTKEGSRRMRRSVEGLGSLGVTIELVLTSPLVRAVETADILAQGLASRPHVQHLSALAPEGTPAATMRALRPFGDRESLALVGHEPDMGHLTAWLIGATAPIPFRKGAVCQIDVPDWPPAPPGTLVWFAPPRMLRRL